MAASTHDIVKYSTLLLTGWLASISPAELSIISKCADSTLPVHDFIAVQYVLDVSAGGVLSNQKICVGFSFYLLPTLTQDIWSRTNLLPLRLRHSTLLCTKTFVSFIIADALVQLDPEEHE